MQKKDSLGLKLVFSNLLNKYFICQLFRTSYGAHHQWLKLQEFSNELQIYTTQ